MPAIDRRGVFLMRKSNHCRACRSAAPAFSQRGVVLLEVLISILLFSLAVLAIVGLQASMVKSTTDAKFRADASYVAQRVIGNIWVNPDAFPYPLDTANDIPADLPNGQFTVTQPSQNQYQVKVTWQTPGEASQHNYTIITSVAGN